VPLLVEMVENQDPLPDAVLVRFPKQRDQDAYRDSRKAAALDALAGIGPEARAAVPALVQSLRQARSSDRLPAWAARALAAVGPEAGEAIPELTRIVRRQDRPTCSAAALALARMGPGAKGAVPALENLARNRGSRVAAAVALWKLDGQVQRPLHIALMTLKGPEEPREERLLAVTLLKEMGPEAKPAVEALAAACDDHDPEVRRAAAEALQRVDAAAAAQAEKR
jgi:HEAT repeat protein